MWELLAQTPPPPRDCGAALKSSIILILSCKCGGADQTLQTGHCVIWERGPSGGVYTPSKSQVQFSMTSWRGYRSVQWQNSPVEVKTAIIQPVSPVGLSAVRVQFKGNTNAGRKNSSPSSGARRFISCFWSIAGSIMSEF